MSTFVPLTATIANGASLSDAVDLNTGALFGIVMPSDWTAASLTFQVTFDGTTFVNLYDTAGNEITWTAAVSQYLQDAAPAKWFGVRAVKVRSGTSGTPVNQGGARSLTLITVLKE